MLDMGFSPCKADPSVWLRKEKCSTKNEYVAIYDDDLVIHAHALQSSFKPLQGNNLKIKRDESLK